MKMWLAVAILLGGGLALGFVRNACAQDDSGYEGAQVPYSTAPDSTDNAPYIVPAPFGSDPAMAPPLNPEGYGNANTLPEDDGTNTMDGYAQPQPEGDDGGSE